MREWSLPIRVAKTKTFKLGGENATRENIGIDVQGQSLYDLRQLVHDITVAEVEQQMSIGNDPTFISVDNYPSKPLVNVMYKTQVNFGVELQKAMIRQVLSTLRRNIRRITFADTGNLQDTSSNWEWVLWSKESGARRVNPFSLGAMVSGQRLILRPKIDYASFASLIERRTDDAKGGKVGSGFMSMTAKQIRRSNNFKHTYAVVVQYSEKNKAQGERFSHGSPILVMWLRRSRARPPRRVQVK